MVNKGYLMVLMEAPPALEEEFQAWYDTEHLLERLAVPGFETGLRFVCIDGAPRYLAMYDLTSLEVLNSAEYLKVSLDKASPWTKRITSRVKVQRYFGEQVFPGQAITGRTSRIILLRFRDLGLGDQSSIIAGMHSNYGDEPETSQIRVLTQVSPTGIHFFAIVEARAPFSKRLDLKAFGACANALDMFNTYAAF